MTQAIAQQPEEADTEPSKEIIPFDEINAVTIFTGGGMPALISQIKERIDSVIVDPTDAHDQAVMRSIDKQINKALGFINNMRLDLVTDKKQELAKIDKVGREAKIEIQQIQHDFIEPLREIEAIEAARKAKIEARWNELLGCSDWEEELSSSDIQKRIERARELAGAEDWGKYSVKIIKTKLDIMQTLTKKLLAQKTLEELRIEEASQKEEEEAQKVKEREEHIRKEAREKAEKKAEEEKAALQKKIDDEKARADQAVKDKKEAEEKAERDRIEAEKLAKLQEDMDRAQAEKDKRTAEAVAARAEQDKSAAIVAAEKAERERIEAVIKAEEEAEENRIADEQHREKIWKAISDSLEQYMTDENIQPLIDALIADKIPHIKIIY